MYNVHENYFCSTLYIVIYKSNINSCKNSYDDRSKIKLISKFDQVTADRYTD